MSQLYFFLGSKGFHQSLQWRKRTFGNMIEGSCTLYIGIHDLHVDRITPFLFLRGMIR